MDAKLGHARGIASAKVAQVVKLVVSHAASGDLERLRLFLVSKNPVAAQRAIGGLIVAINSLTSFPDRGKAAGAGGRRDLIVPLGRSAYIVRFEHDHAQQRVVIMRIWHGREARE